MQEQEKVAETNQQTKLLRPALPFYQSFKVVSAAKIREVLNVPTGESVVLRLETLGPQGIDGTIDVHVTPEWYRRVSAAAEPARLEGGWFVQYEDGYESWSPAAAFENGYRPVVRGPQRPRVVHRWIETHQVNAANQQLEIAVLDEPGSGGACHLYEIGGFNTESNPSDPFVERYGAEARHSTVLFQNGPIAEVGVNGVTHEALLAILRDRLEAFQAGPFACAENQHALAHLQMAIGWLNRRTERRLQDGTEGTHRGV